MASVLAAVAAPTAARLAPLRKQKAQCPAASCPAAKRRRLERRDPIAAAASQDAASWVAGRPAQQLDVSEAAHPAVCVAFEAPACHLAFGEHLRVVGSCPELGGWDPAAAPALEWGEGDRWTGSVALPPGQHAFKLVVVRQDGSVYWEAGADRSLLLPQTVASGSKGNVQVAAATPLLSVACDFGDTARTEVRADAAQLAPDAEAASQQTVPLQEHSGWLGPDPAMMEREVLRHSDAGAALVRHNVEALLASERQQVEAQRAQQAEQQRAVTEVSAALTDAAAAVHAAQSAVVHAAAAAAAEPLAAAPAHVRANPVAAAAARAARPVLAAADSAGGVQLFHFSSSDEEPSALELARQRLAAQLPQEAAAGLDAALLSMGASGGRRRRRAELASLALQGPAVPAEQLYGVGSHERRLLAPRQLGSLGKGADATAEQTAELAAGLERMLSLSGSGSSSGNGSSKVASNGRAAANGKAASKGRVAGCQVAAANAANPVMRASFPGAAAWLAVHSLYTLGNVVWSTGRAVVPPAGRRAADAAVVLACAAAAAAVLS